MASSTKFTADQTVLVAPGAHVRLTDIDLDGARLALLGDDLLVTMADGSTLLLEGLVAAGGDEPPSFEFAGNTTVSNDDLIAAAVTQAAPAAGGPATAAAGDDDGSTVTPTVQGALGPGLDALGTLDPTALQFEAPAVTVETALVDEDDQAPGFRGRSGRDRRRQGWRGGEWRRKWRKR